jgi:serine/threonine protein kinase, bacterial
MLKLKRMLDIPLRNGFMLQERYQISSFIGKGSYGMVYVALDQETNQSVIVKQLRNRKRRNRKELLIKEVQMLSAFNHQAIPKCVDFFHEAEMHFLIMEHIKGKNFEDLVLGEGHTYDEIESLQFLLKVLYVVKYLHEHGVIHRDLRLPNIILKDHQVYVIDFGLAVYENSTQPIPTKSIPLEKQYFREDSVKADFYALGHFLLFLLYSNYEPTSRKNRSWEEELRISNYTRKVIRKMLRIDESYENVNDVIKDVKNIINIL